MRRFLPWLLLAMLVLVGHRVHYAKRGDFLAAYSYTTTTGNRWADPASGNDSATDTGFYVYNWHFWNGTEESVVAIVYTDAAPASPGFISRTLPPGEGWSVEGVKIDHWVLTPLGTVNSSAMFVLVEN